MPSGDKKVQPGEPLDLFPASLYNSMLDVVAWFKQTQGNRDTGRGMDYPDASRQIVLIRNTTGDTRKAGEIVGIDESAYFDLSQAGDRYRAIVEPVLVGVEPEFPSHIGRFAILLDSPADDAMSRAVVSGYAVVQLDVIHATHRYADVTDGDCTKLTSRAFGGAEIIKKEDDETGDKWALVRLGQLHLPDIHGMLAGGDLAEGSSQTFTVYEMADDGSYASVSRTETIWGNMIPDDESIANGSFIWGRPIRESGLIELIQSKVCSE